MSKHLLTIVLLIALPLSLWAQDGKSNAATEAAKARLSDKLKQFVEAEKLTKDEAIQIWRSVFPEPKPPAPKPVSASKSPSGSSNAELLAKIDQQPIPEDYPPENHQPWVDANFARLTPQQGARVGTLWKEKERIDPKMKNRGHSFVRILDFVRRGEKFDGKAKPVMLKPQAQPPREFPIVRKRPREIVLTDPINAEQQAANWHHWRGPEINGVSRTATPPTEWGEEKNVAWKVAVPGRGNSTPIIWGDRVYVTAAIDTGTVDPDLPKPEDQPDRVFGIKYPNTTYRFVTFCFDRITGDEVWQTTAVEMVPHEGTHGDNDFASASPMTDGQRLLCWFGSAGLYCYDLDGKELWKRDLGKAYVGASLGEGCSPVIYRGHVVILRDNDRQSAIEVLDAENGATVWLRNRDEPNNWATPRIVEHNGVTQVITTGTNRVRSYDLTTGEIVWQCGGLSKNCTPCPVIDDQFVFCMSGYKGFSLLAIPLSAKDDITGSKQVAWTKNSGTPYVPSPLLYDGFLYFTQSNNNILTCLDAKTGDEIIERTRLPGISNVYSSPVAAANRVYLTGRKGATVVIERGAEFKVLATNKINDEVNSSAALVGDQLFLRGRTSLYCIQEAAK